jgi:hypothetical protein
MVEAAHAREGDRLRARRRGVREVNPRGPDRVYPFDAVVGDVVRGKPPEVALAEHDHE